MNQLFCDCKTKCTCKKCPDVLKNLNITVTGSACHFNRKPKPGKSDIKYTRKQSTHSITAGRPSTGKLNTETCFDIDKATLELKKQKDNKEFLRKCIEFANEDGMKSSSVTDLDCVSCDVTAKAMKVHGNLGIGIHENEDELNELVKEKSTDEKTRKNSSKTAIKSVSKTGVKNASKTALKPTGKPAKKK